MSKNRAKNSARMPNIDIADLALQIDAFSLTKTPKSVERDPKNETPRELKKRDSPRKLKNSKNETPRELKKRDSPRKLKNSKNETPRELKKRDSPRKLKNSKNETPRELKKRDSNIDIADLALQLDAFSLTKTPKSVERDSKNETPRELKKRDSPRKSKYSKNETPRELKKRDSPRKSKNSKNETPRELKNETPRKSKNSKNETPRELKNKTPRELKNKTPRELKNSKNETENSKNETENSKSETENSKNETESAKHKKDILVLDLDETLVSAIEAKLIKNIPDNVLKTAKVFGNGELYVFCRPGLCKFLRTMEGIYKIVIWTAGTKEYATFINDIIITPCLKKPIPQNRVFHRDQTDLSRDSTAGVYHKDLLLLAKLMDVEVERMFIIDNRSDVFKQRKPGCVIQISDWIITEDPGLHDRYLAMLPDVIKKLI
jgi:TFIIF-interacting CTD phosphatase-like protein